MHGLIETDVQLHSKTLVHCTRQKMKSIHHSASGKLFTCGRSGASDMSDRCGKFSVRNIFFPFFHHKYEVVRFFSVFNLCHVFSESEPHQNSIVNHSFHLSLLKLQHLNEGNQTQQTTSSSHHHPHRHCHHKSPPYVTATLHCEPTMG